MTRPANNRLASLDIRTASHTRSTIRPGIDVTHEKNLVNRFDKRVVAIENGRIISDGTGGYYNGEKI